MTALDSFQPTGTPIHPFDLYVLLDAGWPSDPSRLIDLKILGASPQPEDPADYERNLHKMGQSVEIFGKVYFETTSVTPVTKEIA